MGTDRLGEEEAWRLVLDCAARRDVAAGSVATEGPLRIEPDGSWSIQGEVTREGGDLLALFLPLAVRPRWVVGQLGQSLDGRIATESGHSHYVTGPEDRVRLHRLRALVDAVVIGAGTAASDDPRLTVRSVVGGNPVRVVLDPRGRLDPGLALFTDGAAPTLWVQDEAGGAGEASASGEAKQSGDVESPREVELPRGVESPDRSSRASERTRGVDVVRLPCSREAGFEPSGVVAMLRGRGLQRILVEGGGTTVSRFLQAGALDRLHVTVAPLLLGSGRPALTLPPIETLDEALRPPSRFFRMGEDLLVDLELDRARA